MSSKRREPSDAELVADVRAGNVHAYADILARYETRLLRYVTYLIGDASLAHDVVQDTFLKAYQNLHGFRAGTAFSPWVYRIAHNEAINTITRETRHRRTDIDTLPDIGYEPHFEELVDATITHRRVHDCVRQLEPKYQAVVQLVYLENMKYETVSDILHVPVSTVGVWLSRAKAKLKIICQRKGVRP